MDYIDRLVNGQGFQQPANLFKFTNLDRPIQLHLQKVYATLAVALAVCAAGCATDIMFHVGGILTFFGALGCLIGLGMTPATPQSLNQRYLMLGGFSFCQGASLGPLVGAAISIHSGLVFSAFLATCAVFVSFSMAALVTGRRTYLYLGGWLASAVTGMAVLRLCSWIFGARALAFQVEVYLGLIVFAAYIIYDTQVIVEKAAAGCQDHVKHALDLLVDVIAVFVRVLVILMRNAEKAKDQEARKKRRD